MAGSFTLYGSPNSQFTFKVALMLHLCDQSFSFRYINFRIGAHRTPEFLAMSPFRELLFWDADRLGPAVYRSHSFELGRRGLLPRPADPAVVTHYRELAEGAFEILDSKLSESKFLVGTAPTIADIACYGEVAFAPLAGLEIGSFDNIRRWEQRVAELPGYKQPLQLLPMEDVEVVGAA